MWIAGGQADLGDGEGRVWGMVGGGFEGIVVKRELWVQVGALGFQT